MTERTRKAVRAHIIGCLAAVTIALAAFGPNIHAENVHYWDVVDKAVKILDRPIDYSPDHPERYSEVYLAIEISFKDGTVKTARSALSESERYTTDRFNGMEILKGGEHFCYGKDIVSWEVKRCSLN